MFKVYTPGAEIPLATTAEVVRLLRRYPFGFEADFFTIGRQESEYLEIFNQDETFSLAFIAADADEAVPIADGLDYQIVERVVVDFCQGNPAWRKLLEIWQIEGSRTKEKPRQEPTPFQFSLADGGRGQDTFHHAAPPIEPKAYGCAPFPLLLLATAIALGAFFIYWLAGTN